MQRWSWTLDAGVVIAFTVIGRADHGYESGLGDYVRVASPFLLGLGVSSFALRRRQQAAPQTGLALALGTVAGGVLARRFLWRDGTAFTFIVVTTGFMVAGMVGWRLLARGLARRRSRDDALHPPS